MTVKIVYDPDDSAGRIPNTNVNRRSLVNGKIINVKVGSPDDYMLKNGSKAVGVIDSGSGKNREIKSIYQTMRNNLFVASQENLVKPQHSNKRLSHNPNIPKSLTPKGYTKMQLMMSISKKKYDNIVRKLKGTGQLWEDPDFPLDKAIGNIENLPRYEWKRPKEIDPTADFIVDGFDRSDIAQGRLGDCWLLAVISTMADIPPLFNHIVPPGQTMKGDDYVGVFRFRFWQFGQWIEVLVDDRIPVVAGTKQMIFMHSDESNEFWSALIEKAYAKLNGCYANLSGGTQGEAMEDITGGLVESLELQKITSNEFYKDLQKYMQRCCLMGCSITSKEIEAQLNNGLIAGHAYSVTGVNSVKYKGDMAHLIRIRNPWGNNYEWRGAWADNAPEWKEVSESEKKRLNLTFRGDGEFWMLVDDFRKCFTKLEVCHLGQESLDDDQTVNGKKRLEETLFTGEWVKGVNAGGCANFRDTFWTNPQFKITVIDSDPTDDDNKCTLVIGLMQKNMRRKGASRFFTVGFCVYQIASDTEGILKRNFFMNNRPIAISEFTNTREVVLRLKVPAGTYLIVPSTFNPNEEAQFIVRCFAETHIKESECDDKNSFKGLSEETLKIVKETEKTKNEDDFVDNLFHSAMDQYTKSINAEQLRDILNKSSMRKQCIDPEGFSLEEGRSMLAAMDNNLTGKMEYDEFKALWENCQCWRDVFVSRDKDKSKTLNVAELREALISAGFHVSSLVFTVIVQRFVTQKLSAVTFEDWILCCVRLKNCFDNMKAQFKTNDGNLMFTTDDFLRLSINQ